MAAERRRSLARLGTVRVRTTLAAVVVVGLAMAVGGLALVAVLRDTLTRELPTAARLRATELVTDLRSGALPAELAVGATTPQGRRTVVVARALDAVGDEVARLTRTMNRMLDRLQRA